MWLHRECSIPVNPNTYSQDLESQITECIDTELNRSIPENIGTTFIIINGGNFTRFGSKRNCRYDYRRLTVLIWIPPDFNKRTPNNPTHRRITHRRIPSCLQLFVGKKVIVNSCCSIT